MPRDLASRQGPVNRGQEYLEPKKDREDFIDRLAELFRSGSWAVNAWALMQFVSSIGPKNQAADHLRLAESGSRSRVKRIVLFIAGAIHRPEVFPNLVDK